MKQKLLILAITLISLRGTCTLAFFPMDQLFEYCHRYITGNHTITIDKNDEMYKRLKNPTEINADEASKRMTNYYAKKKIERKENSLKEEIARDEQYNEHRESIEQWRETESQYNTSVNKAITQYNSDHDIAKSICGLITPKEQEAFDHEYKLLKKHLAVKQEELHFNKLALVSTGILLSHYSDLIDSVSNLEIDTLRKEHNLLDEEHNELKQNVDVLDQETAVLKKEIVDFNKLTNRNAFSLSHLKRSRFDAWKKAEAANPDTYKE